MCNIKHAKVPVIGIPGEKVIENIFEEIIAENFPNLKKEVAVPIVAQQK